LQHVHHKTKPRIEAGFSERKTRGAYFAGAELVTQLGEDAEISDATLKVMFIDTDGRALIETLVKLMEEKDYEQALTNLNVSLQKFFYPLLQPMQVPQFKGGMVRSTVPLYRADQFGGVDAVKRVVLYLEDMKDNLESGEYDRALQESKLALQTWKLECESPL
jgi:hypothetical protein